MYLKSLKSVKSDFFAHVFFGCFFWLGDPATLSVVPTLPKSLSKLFKLYSRLAISTLSEVSQIYFALNPQNQEYALYNQQEDSQLKLIIF